MCYLFDQTNQLTILATYGAPRRNQGTASDRNKNQTERTSETQEECSNDHRYC